MQNLPAPAKSAFSSYFAFVSSSIIPPVIPVVASAKSESSVAARRVTLSFAGALFAFVGTCGARTMEGAFSSATGKKVEKKGGGEDDDTRWRGRGRGGEGRPDVSINSGKPSD